VIGKERTHLSSGESIDYECFEELIRQLEADGHTTTAQKLDHLLHRVAWTTGSELIGELGAEILAIQGETSPMSAKLEDTVRRCMVIVRRVWPNIK